jgi:curved DNA-binding protein CbpA
MDRYYYEALGVEPNADPSKIKRQYYLMARKFHPDKNPGDDAAAEKFKLIAEAYQVLSDPELRMEYDKGGRDALSGDKTSANDDQKPDPSLLLAFLFGSDKFNSYVGRLATSTSAMLGDTTTLSAKDARILQERRCSRLAMILVKRIKPWVDMNFKETEDVWKTQAEELKNTSYGWELLQVVGLAYELAAVKFLGSIEAGNKISIKKWAKGRVASTRDAIQKKKNQLQSQAASMDIVRIQNEYQRRIQNSTSEDEKRVLEQEMAAVTTDVMLRIIWTTTSVDITSTIHETCQMVFFDQSVDKKRREMRATAVKRLGRVFQECASETQLAEGERADARILFSEAAMAATLETMKRKDEPSHN